MKKEFEDFRARYLEKESIFKKEREKLNKKIQISFSIFILSMILTLFGANIPYLNVIGFSMYSVFLLLSAFLILTKDDKLSKNRLQIEERICFSLLMNIAPLIASLCRIIGPICNPVLASQI